jgi:ParB family chromosome partitioning protein
MTPDRQFGLSRRRSPSASARIAQPGQYPAPLKTAQEAKRALVDKTITSGHARALLSLGKADQQSQALRKIVAKGLNVREAERLALRIQSRQEGKRVKKDPSLQDVEKRLTAGLQTAVSIRKGRKSGAIQIHFSSNEEMNRLILLLLNATEP